MFMIEDVNGIIVENAQPELMEATLERNIYISEKPFADGVLEGLKEYGVIDTIASISGNEIGYKHYDVSLRHVLKSEFFQGLRLFTSGQPVPNYRPKLSKCVGQGRSNYHNRHDVG
jgi:hypothetical protein